MKKIIYLIFYFAITLNLFSQESKLKEYWEIDFSVPDIPAMKSLGVENSDILRPTTPGELGVQLSKIFDGKNFYIPSAFAMEVKPFALFSEKKIEDFGDFANNFRISLGSFFDTTSKMSNYSIGFRYTFDCGFNEEIKDTKSKVGTKIKELSCQIVDPSIRNLQDSIKKLELQKFNLSISQDSLLKLKSEKISELKLKYVGSLEKLANDPILNEEAEEYAYKIFQDSLNKIFIDSLNNEVNTNYWNKTKFDFALAISFSSKDSTGAEPSIRSYNAWLTYSQRLENWGQLLFGGSFGYYNEQLTKDHLIGSLGARLYGGTNNIKGYVEVSGISDNLKEIKNSLLVNCGFEFKVTKGTWLVYNFGWVDDLDSKASSHFKTNLDFKYNIPELINLVGN